MTQQQALEKVLSMLAPFANNNAALAGATRETSILQDLKVNSARLVDFVLDLEEAFGLEISDDEADSVRTLGDAVDLILAGDS